ncbi:MAG: flap endonuclease-1 [Candidatus Aenigmarchaeota archaeon]|nr:flap endonuclease-1 [Candidatus Aenigmarchaeota archaeon]
MGVKFGSLIRGEKIDLSDLKGKIIGIDAFLFLHQFLSSIRQPDGTPLQDSKGRITSHLSGIFYRTAKLIEAGIKPVYVFDGPKPEFKYVTAQRRAKREESMEKWKKAIARGDIKAARKYAQASLTLSDEMIEQAKKLLEYMGVPVVQAPSEGEAQIAAMVKKGQLWAAASQDADTLLFGSPRLIRNLSISGRKKLPGKDVYIEIKPELIKLDDVLKALGISRDQLIIMAMIMGTDFNPGIRLYGPKKSLKLVKEYKTLDKVLENIDWNSQFKDEVIDAREIFDFFKKGAAKDVKIKETPLDEKKIIKMMVHEFEFSEDRVLKVIENMKKYKASSSSLSKWLK